MKPEYKKGDTVWIELGGEDCVHLSIVGEYDEGYIGPVKIINPGTDNQKKVGLDWFVKFPINFRGHDKWFISEGHIKETI